MAKGHREAIGVLEYGLRVRKGFTVITGEVGVGKTTVLRHSLRRLDPATSAIVYVLQPSLSPHQLITYIWNELTGETDPVAAPWMLDTAELIRHLLFRLKALHDAGKLTVIVIDEAHNMPVETLESLRLLSNLETDKQKFVQVVLAGQPELDEKLARHELRQLNQRIAVRTRIDNLSTEEAIAYIQYRLDMAAGRPIEVFAKSALDYIAKVSGGNPRRLNIFCDNALINALGYRERLVTRAIAAEAIAPHLTSERVRRPQIGRYALAASVLLALALGIGFGAGSFRGGVALPSLVSRAHDITKLIAALPRDYQPVADVLPRVVDDKPPIAVTAPPIPRAKAMTYKVETQHTLDELCKLAYGICGPGMVRTLAQVNPAIDPAHLVAGQAVDLPVIENLMPVFP
ncbi:MAG TPA: AAA family ATPase [Stellaceae bacterium]|nr:AAA family ATPase [Stellaceae bacterium]